MQVGWLLSVGLLASAIVPAAGQVPEVEARRDELIQCVAAKTNTYAASNEPADVVAIGAIESCPNEIDALRREMVTQGASQMIARQLTDEFVRGLERDIVAMVIQIRMGLE